ncbi:MAG: hypothetical protein VCC20_05915 [Myxococcota bacterium]
MGSCEAALLDLVLEPRHVKGAPGHDHAFVVEQSVVDLPEQAFVAPCQDVVQDRVASRGHPGRILLELFEHGFRVIEGVGHHSRFVDEFERLVRELRDIHVAVQDPRPLRGSLLEVRPDSLLYDQLQTVGELAVGES